MRELAPGTFFRFTNAGDTKHVFRRTDKDFITANHPDDGRRAQLPEDSGLWSERVEIVPVARHDGKPLMLFSELAQWALEAQNGVNLTGVIASWHRCTMHLRERLQYECSVNGTAANNQHPINVLFADKLAALAGVYTAESTMQTYSTALQVCERLQRAESHDDVAKWNSALEQWEIIESEKKALQDA